MRPPRTGPTRSQVEWGAFIEDVTWMAETGETMQRAARRIGINARALERRLRRRGRGDLALTLIHNGGFSEAMGRAS